jgi:hypothetical protein
MTRVNAHLFKSILRVVSDLIRKQSQDPNFRKKLVNPVSQTPNESQLRLTQIGWKPHRPPGAKQRIDLRTKGLPQEQPL